MKHLPNLLTLGNLFCGCLAIAYILTAQPYVYNDMATHEAHWIFGSEQLYYGSIFIGIAAICDMLDGFTARALKVFSPIGKDLDSLADVVSFGVAPAIIMFKLLWDALQQEKNALDVHMLGMAPAFLIACFAALRLAKFNITADGQKQYFIGMPTPAVGLFIGSFPILVWYNEKIITSQLHNKWVLYGIIALVCWLMVSNIKFFKFIPSSMKLSHIWPQIILIIAGIVGAFFIQFSVIPILFLIYILLSIVYRHPSTNITS